MLGTQEYIYFLPDSLTESKGEKKKWFPPPPPPTPFLFVCCCWVWLLLLLFFFWGGGVLLVLPPCFHYSPFLFYFFLFLLEFFLLESIHWCFIGVKNHLLRVLLPGKNRQLRNSNLSENCWSSIRLLLLKQKCIIVFLEKSRFLR